MAAACACISVRVSAHVPPAKVHPPPPPTPRTRPTPNSPTPARAACLGPRFCLGGEPRRSGPPLHPVSRRRRLIRPPLGAQAKFTGSRALVLCRVGTANLTKAAIRDSRPSAPRHGTARGCVTPTGRWVLDGRPLGIVRGCGRAGAGGGRQEGTALRWADRIRVLRKARYLPSFPSLLVQEDDDAFGSACNLAASDAVFPVQITGPIHNWYGNRKIMGIVQGAEGLVRS